MINTFYFCYFYAADIVYIDFLMEILATNNQICKNEYL